MRGPPRHPGYAPDVPEDPGGSRPRAPLDRREFLGLSLGTLAAGAQDSRPATAPAALARRPLGRTREDVAILALGTHPLSTLPDAQEAAAVEIVRRAIAAGVNYIDTAPSYPSEQALHRAERRVAAALAGCRDRVLLATKSYRIEKARALAELEGSLRALGTDRVDVFQVHAVGDRDDLRRKLDPDKGTLAAALAAQQAGKCRFLGVTGHADPEVMAECLAVHAFATLLVPVNIADPLWRSFVRHTLPKAKAAGTAVVAMKVFAAGRLVAGGKTTPAECLRFALSQDVATAVVGARSVAELEADLGAARAFQPMPPAEQERLGQSLAPHPGQTLEWYKRS